MEEKKLVPSRAVHFPGSFAARLREDHRKLPDTRHWRSRLSSYFTDGWNEISIWKSAVSHAMALITVDPCRSRRCHMTLRTDSHLPGQFIEFVGSTALCYLSGMIHTTIGNFNTQQAAAYVGVTNIVLISLFIYGMAPASGGHINQIITFSTMTTGLTGFSRGILYLIAQTAGAALAGGLIRGSFGKNLSLL
jgi:hypothetical protein